MTFHQYSKQIVEDYLGTVAYVDDLIFTNRTATNPINLGKPNLREISAEVLDSDNVEKEKKQPIELQLAPNINPLSFTNAFLNKGIHCALLEVTKENDSLDTIKKILNKSDVVILDWQMHQDLGKKATELLFSVLKVSNRPELRLIIIFTNDKHYNSILPGIIIPKLKENGIDSIEVDKSECKLLFGHTKIVVLSKENGVKTGWSVSDEELPDKVIEEFSEFTEGLVANTALKAISVIRRNSHNLLGVFNDKLDSGYLTHRAFLESPSDSETHIIEWFSDEIRDLLYMNGVAKEVDIDKIELLLNSFGKAEYSLYDKDGNDKKKMSSHNMIKLFGIGCTEYNQSQEQDLHKLPPKWFNYFYKSFEKDKTSNNVNEKLAALSSLSLTSFNDSLEQMLTLGAIVKKADTYLLCIQPRCDSVRLKNETMFIFIGLVESANTFDLVIPDGNDYKKVKIFYKTDNYKILSFEPNNGAIYSKTNSGKKIFVDSESIEYEWIANLKFQFAQRISNKFASEISRVGLNESEWLRRHQDK